jgi:hypothetical protein
MKRRYTESMRHRIDLDEAWKLACRQIVVGSEQPDEVSARLPLASPFSLDVLLEGEIDPEALLQQLVAAGQGGRSEY